MQRIGRYEVLSHLASGGMGQVYLARATGLGGFERQVVVKTLDLSITDDDEAFVTMFLDEARLVGALHHQYIAPVYEVGCDDEGRYYIVMDYVAGETAEAVFRSVGEKSLQVSLAFSLTVVSCVASALDYAHGLCAADGTPLDIVHRDISLSNVMIGYDGGIKLIDFGIAKASNRATKTQVGTLKGKIGYLAPEQILRKHVDHRADIFALGIVLYELTTQARAFRESSDLNTLERITTGEFTPPTKLIPNYPPELEAIVMKALQVDPDARFQDAGAMGRELEALAARLGLALGHAPVIDVMIQLFGDKRIRRRRLARASNEVSTDLSVAALPNPDDEKTPIIEVEPDEDTDVRSSSRSLKPTLPLGPSNRDDDRATIPLQVQPPDDGINVVRARGTRDRVLPDHPSRLPTPVPLEERPTPIADPAVQVRFAHARIPLEDRPTPIAEHVMHARGQTPPVPLEDRPPPLADATLLDPPTHREGKPLVLDAPDRPTPPERPSPLSLPRTVTGTPPPLPRPGSNPRPGYDMRDGEGRRPPTGPQPQPPRIPTGPQPQLHALEDAPTEIAAMSDDRDDPTDVSGVLPQMVKPPTATAQIVRPRWGPAYVATAVVSKMRYPAKAVDPAVRTWLLLCALFGAAVLAAIIVALI
ncbi:MAG TPA: protein kinase [Kofleriaceae bacterium]|nr:protein kinase [Kofleriaceae bacterium]